MILFFILSSSNSENNFLVNNAINNIKKYGNASEIILINVGEKALPFKNNHQFHISNENLLNEIIRCVDNYKNCKRLMFISPDFFIYDKEKFNDLGNTFLFQNSSNSSLNSYNSLFLCSIDKEKYLEKSYQVQDESFNEIWDLFSKISEEIRPIHSYDYSIKQYLYYRGIVFYTLSEVTPNCHSARIHLFNDKSISIDFREAGESFENEIFWNFRYLKNSKLGSGVGSRGKTLAARKKLISAFKPDKLSVLDFGHGDFELMKSFTFREYTGYDVSKEANTIAKLKRPDLNFIILEKGTFSKANSKELIICIDVLIHQSDYDQYNKILYYLIKSTKNYLIVTGYKKEYPYKSKMIFFHENIVDSLISLGDFKKIYQIGEGKEYGLFVAVKEEILNLSWKDNLFLKTLYIKNEAPKKE